MVKKNRIESTRPYVEVVTSGPYVTGMKKHDQREFVWTLHKANEEWESSSK